MAPNYILSGSILMKRLLIVFLLITACVGCDQISKYAAEHFLKRRPALSFMGDTFRLDYAENSGAFLSLGARLPEHVRKTVFVVLVSIFLVGFLLYVIFSKTFDTFALSSSALMIGGGFGNLIDRIWNQGAVVDFMNIGIGSIRTGIFNFADVAIMAGMVMFAFCYLKKPPNQADTGES